MHNTALAISSDSLLSTSDTRFNAIDIQRGFIMALMALSHCQEYVGINRYSNEGWDDSSYWHGTSIFELLHQIFVSMMVTGGFFLMMGMGLVFLWEARLKQGWPLKKICRYLIIRGSLLVGLQLTVLQIFEIIAEKKLHIYIGVLFALGSCMIAASLVLYFIHTCKSKASLIFMRVQYSIPLLLIITILALTHMNTRNLLLNNAEPSLWQIILLLGGKFSAAGIEIIINFTPLPWFAAVAFGLILGQIVSSYKKQTFRIFEILAILLLSSWLFLRLTHYGEYKIFLPEENPHFFSIFCMSKYPPSISYFLWSFGVNLSCIAILNRFQNAVPMFLKLFEPLKAFGRTALFFFVAHWFVYYGLSLFFPQKVESVATLLLVWAFGLMMLYTMCLVYYEFKMKKAQDSVWRMF